MRERDKDGQEFDVEAMKRLLYGDPTTGRGGLAHTVETIATTLYGGDKNPGGGIVADVLAMKKLFWMFAGASLALQAGLQVLFHFWK